MSTIADITKHVESLTRHRLNRDEGIHHGPADRTVRGVTLSWMASPDAIQAAGDNGHQLLISHESLYYPYDVVVLAEQPAGWREWPANRQRRQMLDEYGLSFLRLHNSVDEICIWEAFTALLGLGEPVVSDVLVKIYEIPECSLAALVARVKDRLHLPAVRLTAAVDMGTRVHRVGVPLGGAGLFVNVGYQQRLVELGCDVFIAGESDSYGFRFAA